MFTVDERDEVMRLLHAIIKWQAADTDTDYIEADDDLHRVASDTHEATITKLIAAVNMKTMREVNDDEDDLH